MILSAKQIQEANERVRLVLEAEEVERQRLIEQSENQSIPESEIIDYGYDYHGDDFDDSPIQSKYIITKDNKKHYV